MRKLLIGLTLAGIAVPTVAALPIGTRAPEFTTTGALAGKPFKLDLTQQLKHGPVVLYFFPKAFTQGCTMEAHAFSDASSELCRSRKMAPVGTKLTTFSTLWVAVLMMWMAAPPTAAERE